MLAESPTGGGAGSGSGSGDGAGSVHFVYPSHDAGPGVPSLVESAAPGVGALDAMAAAGAEAEAEAADAAAAAAASSGGAAGDGDGGVHDAPPASATQALHPMLRVLSAYLFIHATSLGLLTIALPNLLLRLFDGDDSRAAYVYSWTSALTASLGFFFYPVLAMLSDHYGRKPFVLLSLLGVGCAFLLLGLFNSLSALIAAACVRGVTDVAYTITWAALGDVTPKRAFIATYGKLQAASGLGVIIGPVLAVLAELLEKERLPFFLAAGLEAANVLFILRCYKETLFHFERQQAAEEAAAAGEGSQVSVPRPASLMHESLRDMCARRTLNPFKSLLILRSSPTLYLLALALFFQMAAFSGSISVFFLYTHRRFDWGSRENTAFILTLGSMTIFANAALLPWLLRRRWVSEARLLTVAVVSALLMPLVWAGAPASASWLLFVACVLLQCAFFLTAKIRGLLSRQITPNRQGELQGALSCLVSLASIVGPLLLNSLFGYFISDSAPFYFPGAPFAASFLLHAAVAALLAYVWHAHRAQLLAGAHAYAHSPLQDVRDSAQRFGAAKMQGELRQSMMSTGMRSDDEHPDGVGGSSSSSSSGSNIVGSVNGSGSMSSRFGDSRRFVDPEIVELQELHHHAELVDTEHEHVGSSSSSYSTVRGGMDE